jgi:hypothetical protein
VRQALLPVGLEPAAVLDQCVGVPGQRQRGHVGIETVDDRARLLARAAVRLLDRHVLARLALPVPGKSLVEFDVQLARRVVAHVEQRHGLLGDCRHGGQGQGDLDKVAA